jgi:hypothetical protein
MQDWRVAPGTLLLLVAAALSLVWGFVVAL